MKRKIRRQLAARKQRIERRLARAVRVNGGGPWLGGAGIRYEMGERVEAIGAGGIGGMHQLVRKIGLVNEISAGCIC